MLKTSFLITLLVLIALCWIGCSNKPSTNKRELITSTNTSVKIEPDEAKIEEKNIVFQVSDTRLEALLQQPMPDVVFVFPCSENEKSITNCEQGYIKIKFPAESKIILEDYWRETIKFRYETVIKRKELSAQSYYDKTVVFLSLYERVRESLKKVYIDAPNRKRQISESEVGEIIGFINKKSSILAEQAKAIDEWKSD